MNASFFKQQEIVRRVEGLFAPADQLDLRLANPANLSDPISLCTSGDSTPNRRFNYRFIWKNRGP